jgi:hypothetical protein
MLSRSNGTAGSIVDALTRTAHALTGGYVDWLRAHIEEELGNVEIDMEAEDRCMDLAELSANLRARPCMDKRKVETHDTKELPTRLTRQNIRLASCLAVVLNKRSVDSEVLRIVRKVAMDTAHGHSLNICRWLCGNNPKVSGRTYQECGGLMIKSLMNWTGMSEEKLTTYLLFLQKIDVMDILPGKPGQGDSWVLNETIYDLYNRVKGG